MLDVPCFKLHQAVGFRDGANWKETRFTDESYRAHMAALGLSLPLLLLLVVGLRMECISIDWLHWFDLVFGSHVVGNVFWETITRQVWGQKQFRKLTLLS